MLTTREAAQRLGLKTTGAVRQLILAGRLRAEKFGRDWMIEEAEIKKYDEERRGPGRPRVIDLGQSTPETTPEGKRSDV